MTDFEDKLKKIERIERNSVKYYESLKNPMNSDKLWWDMSYEWEQVMNDIRENHPEEWKEHCKKNNLVPRYNFGDVLA